MCQQMRCLCCTLALQHPRDQDSRPTPPPPPVAQVQPRLKSWREPQVGWMSIPFNFLLHAFSLSSLFVPTTVSLTLFLHPLPYPLKPEASPVGPGEAWPLMKSYKKNDRHQSWMGPNGSPKSEGMCSMSPI